MPASITVPYKILARGYTITGDVRSGLHATVPYFCAWADAITLANDVLASPAATHIGGITWAAPLQFPVPFGGLTRPIYAQKFTIEPCGADGSSPIPTGGLAPGEYFTNAIVRVDFDSIQSVQQTGDDPENLNQLDPANPITACEQSVKINGKVVTRKGSGYTYDTSGKPVPGDIPLVLNEAKLQLKFPRVPYLPWQLVQPYVGKINNSPILACIKGSLLLEGMGTDVTPAPDGSIAQKLVLEFAFNPDPTGSAPTGLDWNSFPLPDGSGYDMISAAGGGGQRPYSYAEFADIFLNLEFAS